MAPEQIDREIDFFPGELREGVVEEMHLLEQGFAPRLDVLAGAEREVGGLAGDDFAHGRGTCSQTEAAMAIR